VPILLSLARRAARRVSLPPDTWARHAIVAELAGNPKTLLDVGGVAGQLAAFLPHTRVTSINVVPPADVLYDGGTLPFSDGSFEAATSLDVLEHLDRADRRAHVEEVVRVASRRILLCCPLGTEEHARAEAELAAWHVNVTGRSHPFLEQHLRYGLPSEAEMRDLVAGMGVEFRFAFNGDFRRVNELFRLGVLVRTRRRPRDVAAYFRARFGGALDSGLAPSSSRYTNRVFLVADATGDGAGRPPRPRPRLS
jgi:hypothetical protein